MKDIRDAFLLLLLGNLSSLIGAALVSYADRFPAPLEVAFYSLSGTAFLATLGLVTLALISAVA
ncbi:hypothetical protein ACKU27_13075 [Sphingobium yanoikuyae]|jgi:hypothetical protein|uniref:hypothetical protein n=1 Tax=Sphingobium yanoikuyae TaxID=13690 RepID=UPI003B913477